MVLLQEVAQAIQVAVEVLLVIQDQVAVAADHQVVLQEVHQAAALLDQEEEDNII